MSKKIGEFLKDKGLVTAAQLDAALRAQLFYGGHIGTCLMELRAIAEDDLGEALAESARVKYAPAKILGNLAPTTIKALPRKLAERYRAVPIGVEEGVLHLCMIDPRNLHSLDEIAFATGRRVKAWVAPEARIYQALDRYYGLRRSSRYVSLCRSLDISERMEALAPPAAAAAVVSEKEAPPMAQFMRSGAAANEEGVPDQGGEYGYGRCWKEIAVDIGVDRRRGAASAERSVALPQLPKPKSDAIRPTLWEATDKLCHTEKKNEAVEAVLEFTAARMARSIFFGVNDEVASVWDSRGSDFDRRRKDKAVFSLTEEKIFGLHLEEDCYRGPLPSKQEFLSFYSALGMRAPQEVLLLPVYFDDHLVAFFYGDGGDNGSIAGETDEFLRLFRIFPLAVNQIEVRDSMRAIGYFFSEEEGEKAVALSPSTAR